MKIQIYNYRSGQQIIPDRIRNSVVDAIEKLDYAAASDDIRALNKSLIDILHTSGWSESIPLSVYSKISITSMFDKTGLCIQTGNVARIYADILKLQTLYTDEKISAGIVVLPVKECADNIGKNVASYERFLRELTFIFSKVITVPLLIIGFDSV